MRRRYKDCGRRCGDCGWFKPVTRAVWWVSGYSMMLCAACLRMYRPVLLAPDGEWKRDAHRGQS